MFKAIKVDTLKRLLTSINTMPLRKVESINEIDQVSDNLLLSKKTFDNDLSMISSPKLRINRRRLCKAGTIVL